MASSLDVVAKPQKKSYHSAFWQGKMESPPSNRAGLPAGRLAMTRPGRPQNRKRGNNSVFAQRIDHGVRTVGSR